LAVASLVLGILGLCSAGISAIAGLVLGIVALTKIRQSAGQLGGQGLAIAGVCVSGVFLLLFPIQLGLMLPAFGKAKQRAQTINCVSNLKQLGLAARSYANDHRETFPLSANWGDALQPYVGSPKVFRCAADPSDERCSYGYNSKLDGARVGDVNPSTVLLFEIDGGWNVSGGPSRMIARPRHHVYNVCFADGSVQQVSAGRLGQLRWEP
jgi:hypothetical protein